MWILHGHSLDIACLSEVRFLVLDSRCVQIPSVDTICGLHDNESVDDSVLRGAAIALGKNANTINFLGANILQISSIVF